MRHARFKWFQCYGRTKPVQTLCTPSKAHSQSNCPIRIIHYTGRSQVRVGGELRFDAAVSAASAASASASTATAVAYRDPAWPRNALAMGAVPLTAADFALLQVSVSIPRTSVWVLRELRLGSTHKSHAAMPSRVSILLSTHMTTNPRMN